MLMDLVLGLLLAQEGDKKAPVKEGGQGPMLQVAEVDTNGDGWISAAELKIALGKLGGGGEGQKDGFKKPGGLRDGEGVKKPGPKDGDAPVKKKPLGEGDAPVKKKPLAEGEAPPVKKPAAEGDAPVKKKPVKDGEGDQKEEK